MVASMRHTVGRDQERVGLREGFDAAKAGRGLMLCVSGEPGIGKTTLVEDFLTELPIPVKLSSESGEGVQPRSEATLG